MFHTAPTPVGTGQPSRAAHAVGICRAIGVSRFSLADREAAERRHAAGVDALGPPAINRAGHVRPGPLDPGQDDRLAARTRVTPGPSSRTQPLASCPRQCGKNGSGPRCAAHLADLRMTDAAVGDLYQDLPRLERRNLQIDDFEGLGKFDQNGGGGFHVVDPDDGAIDERRLAKTRSGPREWRIRRCLGQSYGLRCFAASLRLHGKEPRHEVSRLAATNHLLGERLFSNSFVAQGHDGVQA